MSAATADRNTLSRGAFVLIAALLNAAMTGYAGTLAVYDVDGYVETATEAADKRFAGVFREAVTGGTTDGDTSTTLYRKGEFKFASSGLTQADIGKPVFAIDNQTVCKANHASVLNFIFVGYITGVESATECWVDIRPGEAPPQGIPGSKMQLTFSIAGTNAAAYDLAAAAAKLGGTGFYVTSVESMEAYVTATAASAGLKVVTTNFTLATGIITGVGNETANTMVVTATGYLRAA
jgi:hypothetical protein